jgi:hypothetical protein
VQHPIEVVEEFVAEGEGGRKARPYAWSTTITQAKVFANTAGGALPSTIERVANYTPLNTGNFDGILTANDNNVQAAMDTIDDHTHSGLPVDGTYTPTGTTGTNCSAIVINQAFHYLRAGNYVIVSGSVQLDPTAAGTLYAYLTLPVASALATSYDLNGNGTCPGVMPLSIIADTVNDRAQIAWSAPDGTNLWWRLIFMYRVL